MDKLDKVLASLEQSMKARQARKETTTTPQETAQIIWLPPWPETARGVPNSVLRGALFAAIQGKDRRALQRDLLATQQGIQIRFTGWQLDQFDLDVFEQALHLARRHPPGNRCEFTARAFLKALGRTAGKPNHEALKASFARLSGGGVEITHNGFTFGGSLLKFYRDEITERYVVIIDPDIIKLYAAGWTAVEWRQRQRLRRKPLALWLHGFLSSHAEPFPLSVEYLRKISGSRNPQLASFCRQLRKALELLKSVGAILDFEIKDGLVSVERVPSTSQKKHLARANSHKK